MLPKGYLVGNVVADPQCGISQNSQKNYARFTVACDDKFSRVNEAPRSHFFNMISWGRNAHFIQEFVKKGDKVLVEFYASTSSYTNQEGKVVKNIDLCVSNIDKLGGKSGGSPSGSGEKKVAAKDAVDPDESEAFGEGDDDISLDDIF